MRISGFLPQLSVLGFIFLCFPACSKVNSDTNRAPFILSLDHRITQYSPLTVEWTAEAGDVNGDPLTYHWDLGNGTIRDGGATEIGVYEAGKSYTVILRVSDGKADAVEARSTFSADIEDVEVRLDPSLSFQTIRGFGGFGAQKPWWDNAPFYDADFVDLLVNDLGVSILRDEVPIAFEPENDNDDPYTIHWDGFNIDMDYPGADSNLGQHLDYLKAMKEAGLDKLIASVWSPPIWMKHNDHRGNGIDDPSDPEAYSAPPYTDNPDSNTNQLRLSAYEEFAEYCLAYVQTIRKETGIELYALSLQNEPRFSQFYASCVHSPGSLRDLIKVVGERFRKEGLQTRIFAPEDVASIFHIEEYLNAVIGDPVALENTGFFAIHNYANDGINPGDEGPANWARTHELAQQAGKEVWMTETSGFSPDYDGAMALASSMYNALYYGHANAWVYWQLSGPDEGNGVLIQNGSLTPLYHVSKQYFRHIRPGARRFGADSPAEQLLALAFEQADGNGSSIVLTNLGEQALTVHFSGPDELLYAHMEGFHTTSDGYRTLPVTDGSPNLGDGVTMPPRSLLTLVLTP